MLESLEQSLVAKGMSDHGMLEFLKDLWDELMIAYQTRNTFLIQLTTYREMNQLYRVLETETSLLADFRNETSDIYSLIRRKESLFGNFLTLKYSQVEHKSELFALRADILKRIEEYQRQKGARTIQWHGLSYGDICRLEKQEADNRLKSEIREELEAKRVRRGTAQSTYSRLMV